MELRLEAEPFEAAKSVSSSAAIAPAANSDAAIAANARFIRRAP